MHAQHRSISLAEAQRWTKPLVVPPSWAWLRYTWVYRCICVSGSSSQCGVCAPGGCPFFFSSSNLSTPFLSCNSARLYVFETLSQDRMRGTSILPQVRMRFVLHGSQSDMYSITPHFVNEQCASMQTWMQRHPVRADRGITVQKWHRAFCSPLHTFPQNLLACCDADVCCGHRANATSRAL